MIKETYSRFFNRNSDVTGLTDAGVEEYIDAHIASTYDAAVARFKQDNKWPPERISVTVEIDGYKKAFHGLVQQTASKESAP